MPNNWRKWLTSRYNVILMIYLLGWPCINNNIQFQMRIEIKTVISVLCFASSLGAIVVCNMMWNVLFVVFFRRLIQSLVTLVSMLLLGVWTALTVQQVPSVRQLNKDLQVNACQVCVFVLFWRSFVLWNCCGWILSLVLVLVPFVFENWNVRKRV